MRILIVFIILLNYVSAGPVKTSLCCCGCTKEPCPSVGTSCGSPRQSCGSHLDIDVVRCDELQRLWDLAELKRDNETLTVEDAASPGFTPFLTESGIPYAIHDRVSHEAMKEFFEKKNLDQNRTSALEIRFSPQKKDKSDKLTIKRIDNMLTELEEMISMMRELFDSGLTSDVSALEDMGKDLEKDLEKISSDKVSDAPEVESHQEMDTIEMIHTDRMKPTTVKVPEISQDMNDTSVPIPLSDELEDVESTTTTTVAPTDSTKSSEENMDFLFEGALPDEEESKAIDEVIRRMKESIGKLSKVESSRAPSLFQLDSSVSLPTSVISEKKERPKRAVKSDNCNDPKLRSIITQHMANDAKSSKRAIQKAAEKEFGGSFNVICSPCEFSFVVSSQKFCEGYKDQLACFVFLQPPTAISSV